MLEFAPNHGNLKSREDYSLGLYLDHFESPGTNSRGLGLVTAKRDDGLFKIFFVEENIESDWLDELPYSYSLEEKTFWSHYTYRLTEKIKKVKYLKEEIGKRQDSIDCMSMAIDSMNKLRRS